MFGELFRKISSHSYNNWDGSGALAVMEESAINARKFILSLPTDIALPDIIVEPTGLISFEWLVDERKILSVTIDKGNELIWVGTFGADKIGGITTLYDYIPQVILDNIRGLYSE